MFQSTVEQVSQIVGGRKQGADLEQVIGVGTDSRRDLSGQLFVALRGENFDGHSFLAQAKQSGAKGFLVQEGVTLPSNFGENEIVFFVKDTLVALQKLAHFWRNQLNATVVAVTGSNGKTSTKDFFLSLVAPHRKVYGNPGNFNNHIGLPLSLLGAPQDVEVLIQEEGMNHLGEIEILNKILSPDITLVTNVGKAHIGELGSIENIAKAKSEIYLSAPESLKVFNKDNIHTKKMYDRYKKAEDLTFSSEKGSDVVLKGVSKGAELIALSGEIQGQAGSVDVPLFGLHNVENLMAAACLALAVGLSPKQIWSQFKNCRSGWGRNQWFSLSKGRLLFDAYNSSPESVRALLDNMDELTSEGQKILILGEMLELGEERAALHKKLGSWACQSTANTIWFLGESYLDFQVGFEEVKNQKKLILSDTYKEELAFQVQSMLDSKDLIFVKGSRGMELERVAKFLGANNL